MIQMYLLLIVHDIALTDFLESLCAFKQGKVQRFTTEPLLIKSFTA